MISGLLLVPFSIPILPAETFIRINAAAGNIANAAKQENIVSAELPQNYADRYGWHEIVDSVKAAYDTLTPQEQADTCIFTDNYGEAAAVDFYGPALGLPKALSGHNSYFIWGPQGCTGKVLITLGADPEGLKDYFEKVEVVGKTACKYCLPFENDRVITLAYNLKAPLEEVWPAVKSYR